MEENISKCRRSKTWNEIYLIVNQLQLKESNVDDGMDKPSCVTELEILFNKLFIVNYNKVKSINEQHKI